MYIYQQEFFFKSLKLSQCKKIATMSFTLSKHPDVVILDKATI